LVLKEPELFDYLKEFHYPDLEKSEGQYDSFDCVSLESKAYIELKSRNTHYETLLIEENKYAALIQNAGMRSLIPWYINSTPEGVWGFDLDVLEQPIWEEKWLPATTEFARKNNRTKLVGFLHIDDGIRL
jgi:hypothetical protein